MTDRELMQQALDALEDACGGRCNAENNPCWQRDIANALRERLAQPEQEPVAYLCENAVGHKYFRWKKPSSTYKPISLYTTPPQRPWVGLTDEEVQEIMEKTVASCTELDDITGDTARFTWRNIEAKLKEKNGD